MGKGHVEGYKFRGQTTFQAHSILHCCVSMNELPSLFGSPVHFSKVRESEMLCERPCPLKSYFPDCGSQPGAQRTEVAPLGHPSCHFPSFFLFRPRQGHGVAVELGSSEPTSEDAALE